MFINIKKVTSFTIAALLKSIKIVKKKKYGVNLLGFHDKKQCLENIWRVVILGKYLILQKKKQMI